MVKYSAQTKDLSDLAGHLRWLQKRFDSQAELVSGYEDALGSDEVADALHSFANNWSDKRRELSKMLQQAAGYVMHAAEAYENTEEDLTQGIRDSSGSTGGGG